MFYKNFKIVLFTSLFVYCGTSQNKSESSLKKKDYVEATGVASIYNDEIGRAKDDALNDAKLSAVKQVLGTLVQGRTDIDSGVFLSSELTAKTEGFIKDYKVLKQKRISKNEYHVTIYAKVNKVKIQETIADIISKQGRPRMMVLIKEKVPNSSNNRFTATEIEAIFTSQGFPLVDSSIVNKLRKKKKKKIKKALKGNNAAAQSIGASAGAEIVIVGNSVVKNAGSILNSKLLSLQANLGIRVIDVNTGEILAATQEHAAYPHINEISGSLGAIKKVSKIASEKLIATIIKKWKRGKSNFISLLVIGYNYTQIKTFRSELLRYIRGLKNVYRKASVNGATTLEVEFEGKSFDLADRIVDAKFKITPKIGEVKNNSIIIKR